MKIDPMAGQPAPLSVLVDVPRLVSAYYTGLPDPERVSEQVAFGTSGHRGSSFQNTFNEHHVLAITQAICEYRAQQGTDGPLFLGIDTHALSVPACATALEVLAANGVDVMLATGDEYTPTPAVSLAILMHNRGRSGGLADGIVITPSHNPPDNGGFKYNPTNGGPAATDVTDWIGQRANALLKGGMQGIKRMPLERALRAGTTHRYDFLSAYVDQLDQVVDLAAIRQAGVRLGVDPLGGAGVHYWGRIAEQYKLDLNVVSEVVDPTFRFMTLDWDGKIRMDPSSPYAMGRLLAMQQDFDLAFACDTDHDRHGIVTPGAGLMLPDHYLAVAIDYLFQHRPHWGADAGVGKTVVSSRLIERVSVRLGRRLDDVPVGFKWFAPGLYDGTLGFGGEESAGAAFLRRDGTVWTTDKDGLIAALLAGEIKARTGRDPDALYRDLTREFGEPVSDRIEAPATPAQKKVLASLSPQQVGSKQLAGEAITAILTRAPGNGAAIGGVKVVTENGWFAARPSGTEDIYKIYAESFKGQDHLRQIVVEAQAMVDAALAAGSAS
ncbi:MAG: alpha-D-glucose phosphate-specific phosphoglucomutase [Herminiimonas sp.]|nr:alpha-D-glucose phosphate-specific phosphoglucomutase [Herminiimonas sp.]